MKVNGMLQEQLQKKRTGLECIMESVPLLHLLDCHMDLVRYMKVTSTSLPRY